MRAVSTLTQCHLWTQQSDASSRMSTLRPCLIFPSMLVFIFTLFFFFFFYSSRTFYIRDISGYSSKIHDNPHCRSVAVVSHGYHSMINQILLDNLTLFYQSIFRNDWNKPYRWFLSSAFSHNFAAFPVFVFKKLISTFYVSLSHRVLASLYYLTFWQILLISPSVELRYNPITKDRMHVCFPQILIYLTFWDMHTFLPAIPRWFAR